MYEHQLRRKFDKREQHKKIPAEALGYPVEHVDVITDAATGQIVKFRGETPEEFIETDEHGGVCVEEFR